MANQLKQILAFTNVAAAGQATLSHGINVNGAAIIPDEASRDNADFSIISVTSTQVTVQNNGTSTASCNVLLSLDYSPSRAYGAAQTSISSGLTPRPFIPAAGGGGGGGITPAATRTWEFDLINTVVAQQGSTINTNRRILRTMKDLLLQTPGVTVAGSSNGVTAGMDGVDRWAADSDIVWGGFGNPKSWIVLTFANLEGHQMLIAQDNTDPGGNGVQSTCNWTEDVYAGGSTTVLPTAASESFLPITNDIYLPAVNAAYVFQTVYTDDGEQIWQILLSGGLTYGCTRLGIIDNGVTGAPADDLVSFGGAWNDAGGDVVTWTNFGRDSASRHWTTAAGSYYSINWSGEVASGYDDPSTYLGSLPANPYTSRRPVLPMNAIGDQPAGDALLGVMSQQYWAAWANGGGAHVLPTGDAYVLADGSRWMIFDSVAIPWGDDTTPLDVWLDAAGAFASTDHDAYVQNLVGSA